MAKTIKLPTLTEVQFTDPVSGVVTTMNNNFADLSGYSSTNCAGLVQLAEYGDFLTPSGEYLKVASPSNVNDRLSGTDNIIPLYGDFYNVGTAQLPYKTVSSNRVLLSGSFLENIDGELYFGGQPVDSTGGGASGGNYVGPHEMEDRNVHYNVLGQPTRDGETFIRQGSNWVFDVPGRIDPNNAPNNGDSLVYDSTDELFKSQSNYFIERSGNVPFVGDQSMGNNRLRDLDPNTGSYSDYDAIPKKYVDDIVASSNGIPVGSVMMSFTFNMGGFLYCDGGSYNIADYPDLYAIIGTEYGQGDNPGLTFNVPDTRGLFFRCRDDGAGLDPDVNSRTDRGDGTTGDEIGTKQGDQFASHNHAIHYSGGKGSYNGAFDRASTFSDSYTTQNTGGSETRPKNINIVAFIKY